MGSFGERMQREREMRGITLEEIAESTKIGTRSLRALEGEDFDKLPGGIFNKGFVRAYAKYLGIDEEQAVTDFMAAYSDFQQQQPSPPVQETRLEEEQPPASLNLLVVIGGAIAVLALFFVIWGFHDRISGAAGRLSHRFRRAQAAQAPATVAAAPDPAQVKPPSTSSSAANPTPPATNAGTPAPPAAADPTAAKPVGSETVQSPPQMAAGDGFVLLVHARQDAWVKIKADDELLMEGVLKGDKTIRAKQKVVFTTGNAAAIEMSFNGEPQPPLGADNQVKTVVFTPAGRLR